MKKSLIVTIRKVFVFLVLLMWSVSGWFSSSTPGRRIPVLQSRLAYAAQTTYSSGSGTFNVPAGTTTIVVELWAGGGGGADSGGSNGQGNGGGGGGAYAKKTITSPSSSYSYSVGTGGAGSSSTVGSPGGDTTFGGTLVVAKGGLGGLYSSSGGGAGGAGGSGSTGDTTYNGGTGGTGSSSYSGGGGGGAGSTGVGKNATGQTAGGATTENGGAGGQGVSGNNSNGNPGNNYGGGGASGTGKNGSGADGAGGYIRLTYYSLPTVTTQAVSGIGDYTATANGNITATGDRTVTRRGFCYMEGSSGDPTTANSVVYQDGSYGTGAYSLGLSDLLSGRDYRVRSYAVSVEGTAYGTTVGFTTTGTANNILSGIIYQEDGSSPYLCATNGTLTVNLRVEGAGTYSTTCTENSGAFEVGGITPINSGEVVYMYLSGGSVRGSTVLISNTVDQDDIPIIQNRVVLRDDANGSMTNSEISGGDTADADDLISFSGSDITVASTYGIHVYTGDTYAPGGNVNAGKLYVIGNYTGASETITLSGTSGTIFTRTGTFTPTSNTVVFSQTSGDTTLTSGTVGFYHLQINMSGRTGALGNNATVGGNLTITAGTLSVPSTYTFAVTGTSTVTGTLSVSSSGTQTYTGAVSITGAMTVSGTSNLTFGNTVTINSGGTLTRSNVSGTNVITGLLTVSDGGTFTTSNNPAFTLRGGLANSGTFTAGSGTYTFDTNSQTISGSAATTFGGVVAISGAITIQNSNTNTVTVTGNLTGSVSGSTYQNNANATTNFGGAVLATGTLTAGASPNTIVYNSASAQNIKNTTYHHLSFTPTITGSIAYTFSGAAAVNGNFTINPTSSSSNTLTVNLGGTLTCAATSTVTISGTTSGLSVLDTVDGSGHAISTGFISIAAAGSLVARSSTITLTGTTGTVLTKTGGFTAGSSIVIYDQTTGDTTLTSGAVDFYDLQIDMSGRTGALGNNTTVGGDLTITAGTLSIPSTYTFAVTGSSDVTGTLSVTSSGTQAYTGAASITGAMTVSGTSDLTFGNTVTINSGGTLTRSNSSGTNIITGLLTISDGGTFTTSNNPAFTLRGGLANSGTLTAGSGTYTFDTNSQSISGSSAITFGGAVAISGAITVQNSSTNTVTVTGNLTGTVSGSTYQNNASTTTDFKGAVLSTGTLIASASSNTINYTGTSAQTIKAATYHDLNVKPAANSVTSFFGAGTVTVNGNLVLGNGTNTSVVIEATTNDPDISVTGNLTVAANTTLTNSDSTSATLNIDGNLTITGVFTAPAGTENDSFTLAGNFTKAGTFNHNNGQITLDTPTTCQLDYSSDTTFYQFYVPSTAAGKNLQFDETYTTIIANDIYIRGSSCTTGRIFLDSMVDDDPWAINIQTGATQDINYIDLEDADGSASQETPEANSSTQTGSNTGWTVDLGLCPSGPVYVKIKGDTVIKSDVKITFLFPWIFENELCNRRPPRGFPDLGHVEKA